MGRRTTMRRLIRVGAMSAFLLLPPMAVACRAPSAAQARAADSSGPAAEPDQAPRNEVTMSANQFTKPSDAELRKKLTPIQYEVTQNDATEPPFRNAFW